MIFLKTNPLRDVVSWILLPLSAVVYSSIREIYLSRVSGYTLDSYFYFLISLSIFYVFSFIFFKGQRRRLALPYLIKLGVIWSLLSALLQLLLSTYFYNLPLEEVMQTYRFWELEPWFFVLLGIFLAPKLVYPLARP